MNQPPVTAASSFRILRIMWAAFLIHMGMVVFIAEYLSKGDVRPIDVFYYSFCAVVAVEVVVALILRNKLDPAYDALRLNAEDKAALVDRQKLHVFLFAISESIVLFGFVLRFLGTPLPYCIPLYAVGVVLLLLSAPRELD
ncbi:MAG: hypothetical protein ABIP81_03270 [Terriglobales bacterium]